MITRSGISAIWLSIYVFLAALRPGYLCIMPLTFKRTQNGGIFKSLACMVDFFAKLRFFNAVKCRNISKEHVLPKINFSENEITHLYYHFHKYTTRKYTKSKNRFK